MHKDIILQKYVFGTSTNCLLDIGEPFTLVMEHPAVESIC